MTFRSIPSSVRDTTVVALLAAVATAYVLWPVLAAAGSHFAFSHSDSVINAWALAWGGDSLAHGLKGFWSPPIFYPYSNTLAYSENLLGIAIVMAPVEWWWNNPTLTYNVALLLSYVVAAVGGFALGRELTGSRTAGVIAAFAFAFTPYRWAQLTHLQVLWTGWLPLALAALHRALRLQRWSSWTLCVGALVLQVLSYGYSVFQAALAIGLVVCVFIARSGVDLVRLRRLAWSAVVLGMLLVPAIWAYYTVWNGLEPTPGDLVAYSADLSTYLNVFPTLPDARWLPGLAQDEGHLFPGLIVVVLVLAALLPVRRWRPATPWRWTYAALAVLAVLVSLGPEPRAWGRALPIPGIYDWLLSTVPLFGALRVPARFGLLAILACSALAAIGFQRVMAGASRPRRMAVTALIVPLIVWEGYGGPVPMVPTPATLSAADEQVADWLAAQPPGGVLNMPMVEVGPGSLVRQQYATLRHGHPIVSGVSRLSSPLMEFVIGSVSPFAQPALAGDAVPFLRGLGIRYVMVRPALFRDPAVRDRLLQAFERDPNAMERARFSEVVAWEIAPEAPAAGREPGLVRVPSDSLSVSASDHPDMMRFAVDGVPGSRWLTGRPQDGSEWFEVVLDRPRMLAGIDLVVHTRSLGDYPRRLEIVAQSAVGGSPEATVFNGSILPLLGQGWRRTPDQPVIAITFPPQMTSRLRLRQLGHASPWFWAIDELVLWERP